MPRRPRAEPSAEAALLDGLRAVYAEVDARYAGWSCGATTECCRFAVTGREPWVTSLELELLQRAARSRPAPRDPRRLPLAEERPCPLLVDGGCRAYEARPIGCRTFWCHRATKGAPVRHAEVLEWVRRVKELAARHRPSGEMGRPLGRAWRA